MQPPPLSTSSITDPTSKDFAFPTPTDHPASVDLKTDAAHTTDTNAHAHEPKHRHPLTHRPHLHIPRHLHSSLDPSDEPGSSSGQARGAELLRVPKTRSPHARSVDSGTGAKAVVGNREKDGREDEQRDGQMDGGKEGHRNGQGEEYESPATPRPEPVSTVMNPSPQLPPERSRDIWSEIREEKSKSGVTPLYLTKTLTTLQSLTRAHTLKLSTAQRTIEHRVAEWTVLRDKLEAMDAEAGDVGRGLVGAEWGRLVRGAVGLEEDDEGDDAGADEATPLRTLETLQQTTTHSTKTLAHLSSTVEARAQDIEHLGTKITSDCVALERRMGRGLERKMEGIERAERDAKRRDLIINIVTFTFLIIVAALLSKIVLQLSTSTGRWSVGVGKDWVGRAVGFVKRGV